jgi:ABC-type polysaccharide/polyol phosphate export permease
VRTPAAARGNGGVFELWGRRELLWELMVREVRARYRGTVLGQLWSLINPLASMAVYTIVFAVLLKVQVPPGNPSGLDVFALWLLCGLLPWTFLSRCIDSGMGSLVVNSGLVKKVWFPREALVIALVASWVVTFATELLVLVAALMIFGQLTAPLWALAAIPVVLLLCVFCCGIGLMLSVLNVYFRDTSQLVGIGLQVWFYATPIVYPEGLVPDELSSIYGLNPMQRFVSCLRSLLYDGRIPRWQDLLAITVAAGLSLVVGWWIFQRFEPRLAEEL